MRKNRAQFRLFILPQSIRIPLDIMLIRLVIVSTVSTLMAEACFSWGGCGFGGCGISSCGPFCRRAMGVKTLKDDIPGTSGDPDTDFRQCCTARGLPSACIDKCKYKKFTKEIMVAMFFQVDACPLSAAVDMQRCAARGDDHTECCTRNAVHTTAAGDKCLLFCRPDSDNSTMLDISYLHCLDRFDSVNSCFWHDAVREDSERVKVEESTSVRIPHRAVHGGKEEVEDEGREEEEDEEESVSRWDEARRRVEEKEDEGDDGYEIFEIPNRNKFIPL